MGKTTAKSKSNKSRAQRFLATSRYITISKALLVVAAVMIIGGHFALQYSSAATTHSCPGTLWSHLWHSQYLSVHKCSVTISGTIESHSPQIDGDIHILFKPDPQYASMLNSVNKSKVHSYLVVEPICTHTPTNSVALKACGSFRENIKIPPIGTHVVITGSFVTDTYHGWNEVHPLESIKVTAGSNPTPAPTPAPSGSSSNTIPSSLDTEPGDTPGAPPIPSPEPVPADTSVGSTNANTSATPTDTGSQQVATTSGSTNPASASSTTTDQSTKGTTKQANGSEVDISDPGESSTTISAISTKPASYMLMRYTEAVGWTLFIGVILFYLVFRYVKKIQS